MALPRLVHAAGPSAAHSLPASASFFQALIEQATDLVSVLSADGVFVYASPAHRRVLGYEPGALVGRRIFDLVHDDDVTALRAELRAVPASPRRTTPQPYRCRHADGSWRTLDAIVTNLLGDPTVGGIVINARDVTERVQAALLEIAERKRTEQWLRQSEARYRHLVENINEVIFTVDPSGSITYVSPAIERVMGARSAGDVLGRPFLDFIHPDDGPMLVESFRRLLAGKPEPLEYRVIGPEGRVYWLRSQSQAIMEQGRVVAVQGVLTDVTARRHAEMEARQRREELAHIQRLTTAGAMTAEIAHQINQPLAAIVNFAGGLAARLRDGTVEADMMYQVATRIADEARRASEVIRRLRAFLRKGESVVRDCDLNHLVRHVYGLLEEDFRREAVDVHLQLDRHLPSCRLDGVLIEQVILNLLRNALDAMAGCDAPRCLKIETRVVDEAVQVAVSDTGAGLPPDAATRIFDAFFTTKPDGLGLGLSVSRSIVHASGGHLWVEPNAPRGTTVGFTLPRAGLSEA